MTTSTVYVALLDEGLDVYRPVLAEKIADDTFVLTKPADYDPDDERWEFPPGSKVKCEKRMTNEGEITLAIRIE